MKAVLLTMLLIVLMMSAVGVVDLGDVLVGQELRPSPQAAAQALEAEKAAAARSVSQHLGEVAELRKALEAEKAACKALEMKAAAAQLESQCLGEVAYAGHPLVVEPPQVRCCLPSLLRFFIL